MAETLVDAIETSLEDRLSESGIARLPNDPKLLARLSSDIRAHYDSYQAPEKPENHLRPFPSTRFVPGSDLSLANYVAVAEGAWKGSDGLPITQQLKRYLLYSHSVVFLDPLLHLLDYFHSGTPVGGDSFLRLKGLLREYAELRELIVNGVIVPVSDKQYQVGNMRDVSRRYAELGYDPDDIGSRSATMNWILVQVTMELEKLGNRADLFFPTDAWTDVYQAFLTQQQARFSSADLMEPFKVGMLGQVSAINPDAIRVQDMILMRKNEPLFEKYRTAVGEALAEVHASKGLYSDVSTEFERRSQALFRDLEEEMKAMAKKSSVSAALLDQSTKIGLGLATGALTTLLPTGKPFLVAAIATAFGALAPTTAAVITAVRGKQDTAAFRRHFMVLKGNS